MDVRLVYLLPFFCVSACNWLQGPYFYAVYKTKFAPEDVDDGLKKIYIYGYSMSLFSSIFAGFWTDRLGRKGACICCCLLYTASCISVHSDSMPLLIIGRILGGVASTLFHTAFESWLNDSKINTVIMSELFYLQTSLGGIVAILSGGVAFYSTKYFGLYGPFRVAAGFSFLGAILISCLWQENYGGELVDSRNISAKNTKGRNNAVIKAIPVCKVLFEMVQNRSLLLLAVIQILFEGPMHVFIMLWNPALQDAATNDYLNVKPRQVEIATLPDVSPLLAPGITFSAFMVSLMLGSYTVSLFTRKFRVNPESCLIAVFCVSTCSLYCASISSYLSSIVPNNYYFNVVLGYNDTDKFYTYKTQMYVYFFFIMYEFAVGVYFPCIAICRSRYISNTIRASITSICRVPQNLFVILLLLYKADLKIYQRLQMSAAALFIGVFLMLYLNKTVREKKIE
jgi:MFS transporter, MFS domain-containing protein family, molybdate-anion transporter